MSSPGKQKLSGKEKNKQAVKQPAQKPFPQNKNKNLMYSLAGIIAILAFVLYANTFSHGYTLDDYSVIKENNVTTQGTEGISTILKTSYRYGYLSIEDGLYRPLSLIMFAIEWEYFPDSPGISHFINVLFYALTGFFLFLLLWELLREYNVVIPFIASALFIAHPIHTEIVASIKSRDEIMCFFLMILSFYFFIKRIKAKLTLWLVLSGVCFFLAMLSKESGITMLAIFPLMMYFFMNMSFSKIIVNSLPFIVVTGIYFFIRSRVLDAPMSLESISYIDNSLVAAPDLLSRFATAMKVLGMYLQLLVFPHPMVCDRSFNQIPNVTLSDIMSITSIVVYIAMLVYALLRFKQRDILSFSILFYLGTIALFSNIFVLIGSIMAERFVYFASFGFCLALAVLLAKAFKTDKMNQLPFDLGAFFKINSKLLAIVGLITILYSFKTIDRNADWKNNFTLYSNDVNISSQSTRMHYYLGRELIKEIGPNQQNEQKRKEYLLQGIGELEKSIAITPSYSDAYSQMGLGYTRLGDKEKAIECYLNALKHSPNDPISMNNLAAEYFTQGKYAECIEMYKKVLAIDPRYVDAMTNLGSCYGTVKDYDNAIFWFRKSLEINPNNSQATMFLSMTYRLKGDNANADAYYKRAVELDPSLNNQK